MKKTTFVLAAATALSVLAINCQAQYVFLAKLGAGMVARHVIEHDILHTTTEASTEAKVAAKAKKSSAKLMMAKSKAAFDFSKQFKDQPNAKWYVGEEVITANFKQGDVTTDCIYDKKGRWIHTMKMYPESYAPSALRKTIWYGFPDYEITQVQEIKEGHDTFYVVYLQNGKNIKLVGVFEGQTNVMKEFTEQ